MARARGRTACGGLVRSSRTVIASATLDAAPVVAMAKSLDMTTTAEGVETAEEADLIRNLGCDKIQGYYFGRPMSSEEARKLFLRGERQSA